MSLTPAADDPNRKEELARKKQNPDAFGTSVVPASSHREEAPNGGLKTDAAPITQEEPVTNEWDEFLDQAVDAITPQLGELDDEQLVAMRGAEAAGKNRKTLLAAIDEEVELRTL